MPTVCSTTSSDPPDPPSLMICLGLDPSLTAFGWAIYDTGVSVGRCPARGLFRTSASTLFIDRNIAQRESLRSLIHAHRPARVGVEFPVYNALYSAGCYGLFLYVCEALKSEGMDVVFWSPGQVKAHARELISRPPKWKMEKPDMVEAAKADAGPGKWNHNEADAYHVARLSARFWGFFDGVLTVQDLTQIELKYFTEVQTFTRGKNAGRTVERGVLHREDERFFLWSSSQASNQEI